MTDNFFSNDESPNFLRSFGRIKGRCSASLRARLSSIETSPYVISKEKTAPVDPRKLFTTPVRRVLCEIGFGTGEHLAALSQNVDSDTGVIGAEPYRNGVASLLKYWETTPPAAQVRIWNDDARLLLTRFPPASLDGIYILFPDPWQKKRHHKRRLISSAFLSFLANIVKAKGFLRIATDHNDYAAAISDKLDKQHLWLRDSSTAGFLSVPTKYSQKASQRQATIHRFSLLRSS